MATDKTANEQLFDYLARNQIGLLLLARGISKTAFQTLDATERDVRDAIRRRLAGHKGLTTPEDVRRLETLLRIIAKIRSGAWTKVKSQVEDDLTDAAKAEPGRLRDAVDLVSPVVFPWKTVAVGTITALVARRAYMGRTLRQWLASIEDDEMVRIRAAITAGMRDTLSAADIARAVVGTVSLGGTDGATMTTRRALETIIKTGANFFPGEARDAWITLQKGLVSQELYVAVLDGRTTPVCRANDGGVWDIGKGPHPPLHPNCRSHRVPLIDGVKAGLRTGKAWTERLLAREWGRYDGRETYEEFRRRRISELTGPVPLETSYSEWLREQSTEFQDEIMGKAKAQLFRRGGLTLDKFVNVQGKAYTLKDLARMHSDAFRAAGLDPAKYA